jgi:hypothetical protein
MAGSNALSFLSQLDSAFENDPLSVALFRLDVDTGSITWAVDGDTLTVLSDEFATFTATLSANTVGALVQALITAGFTVFAYDPANASLSAAVLMDGSGSTNDPLLGFTSYLWAMGEAIGVELDAMGVASDDALRCAVMLTSEEDWLDLWGSYFGIGRESYEVDPDYVRRIVVEVLRPRCNNVAMEMALEEVFQQVGVSVVDVSEWGGTSPLHDGTITFDGTHEHNAGAVKAYGLFDVQLGYDLLGGVDPVAYLTVVTAIVNRMRAAGTYLRDLSLSSSSIFDTAGVAVDKMLAVTAGVPLTDSALAVTDGTIAFRSLMALGADSVTAAADSLTLTITEASAFRHDGKFAFDGSKTHNSGTVVQETL